MGGLDVLERVRDGDDRLTSIMITGNGDVPMAIAAMKAGASDFYEKPVDADHLLSGVRSALERSRDAGKRAMWYEEAANRIASLRSEEHTSELQSLMRISYAVFCLKKKNNRKPKITTTDTTA